MTLGDRRIVEGNRQAHDDRVIGLVERDRVAMLPGGDLRSLDEPLGPQEPDREVPFVARRTHRDRHGDGVLVRSSSPDLERRLPDHEVSAHLERVAAHRNDRPRGDVPGR
jgi:hypothetical protein